MAPHILSDLIRNLILFQTALLVIVLSNSLLLRRARRHMVPQQWPPVSILVPALNEERNIEECVLSLLAQDYPEFEVLVLDDGSTDGTRGILERLAQADPRLTLLRGNPLPSEWTGKNWACAQLSAAATGELLFFTDADTVHAPIALGQVVTALEGEQADLLSGLPRESVGTWGERLIVPFFLWAIYCFTPLFLAYRLKQPALSTAVGQVLLFRRQAYRAIGGHAAVRSSIVDDLALARRIKSAGFRWRLLDVTDLIACRMYRSGREAFAGLSKNLFAAFDFRLLTYLFVWGWLLVVFFVPPLALLSGDPQIAPGLLCMALSFVLWLIPYQCLRLPLWLSALYPLTLLVVEGIALTSLWQSLTGRLAWKGRALVRPQWRWL